MLVWMSLPITFIFKSKKEVSLSEVFVSVAHTSVTSHAPGVGIGVKMYIKDFEIFVFIGLVATMRIDVSQTWMMNESWMLQVMPLIDPDLKKILFYSIQTW